MNIYPSRAIIFLVFLGLLLVLVFSSTPSIAAPEDVPELVQPAPLDVWTMDNTFAYWAEQCEIIPFSTAPTADSVLKRRSLAGGSVRTLDDDPDCSVFGAMAADESGVYYAFNKAPGTIYRHRTGANAAPQPLANNVGTQISEIILDNTYVYWTTSSDKIMRVPKAGGTPQTIIDADKVIIDFAVDGGSIYWMEFGGNFGWTPNKNCGSPPCPNNIFLGPKGRHLLPGPPAFAGDPPFMYYVDDGSQQLRIMQCRTDTGLCSFDILHDTPTDWVNRGIAKVCIPGKFGNCFGDTHVFLLEARTTSSGSRVVRVKLSGGSDEIGIGESFMDGIYLHEGYVYFAEAATSTPGIYRLPFNAAPIERDLQVVDMEVNQAVQNLNNTVPLVAAKPTYVRVFANQLKGPRAMSVEAWLYGERNGQPLPDSPLRPLNGPLELVTGTPFDRADEDGGWLFKLPFGWTLTSALELEAVVDPREAYADLDRDNNRLQETIPVTGEPNSCLFFSPVSTHTPLPHYNDPNFWPTLQRYESLWPMPGADVLWWGEPIEELETCWWGIAPYPCFRPYELDQGWDWDNWVSDRDRVIATLILRQAVARVESPFRCVVGASVHSVGMVHPDADTTNDEGTTFGYANLFFNASWTKFPKHNDTPSIKRWDWPDEGSTLAQEITHNFWRNHVNCGNPEGVDDDFPYEDPCKLDDGALDQPGTHFGFDSIYRKVISPNEAADFMSYANDTWVTDYTYKGVKGDIGLFLRNAGAMDELAQADETVIISGFYDPDKDLGRLNYAYTMDTAELSLRNLEKFAAPPWTDILYSPQHDGGEPLPGRLLLKDADGNTLDDRAVDIIPSDDHSFEDDGFFFAAAFPAPAEPVALVQFLVDGAVVAETAVGSAVPQVQILQPSGGSVIDQPFTIRWRATDADEDILLFNVHYSPDEGQNWFPLDTDYPGTFGADEVTLILQNPQVVPGSEGQKALIKVTASDGFNSKTAVSQPFSVVKKSPQAFISVPAAGQVFDAGEAIPLQGSAYDPEDGSAVGDNFVWAVNNSEVGSEAAATAEGLPPGDHEVQLTVEDRDGNEATATTGLTVLPLQIPLSANSPNFDGRCNDTQYSAAKNLRLSPYSAGGGQVNVRLLRTGSDLWACFAGLEFGQDGANALAALLIDEDYSRDENAQSIDTYYGVRDDGSPEVKQKAAGSAAGWNPLPEPAGFGAKISVENEQIWQAELRIPAGLIDGWGSEIGLGLWVERPETSTAGDAYWPYLPPLPISADPARWAHTILADAPVLDDVQPAIGLAGADQLDLTLSGRNFAEGAQVFWQGNVISATRNSPTEMVATVAGAALGEAGSFSVHVQNEALPQFPSNARLVTLLNPQPVIASLSPDQVDAGSDGLLLTIEGQGFVEGAVVMWDGQSKATTYISPTKLQATINAADLLLGGNIAVAVRNPDPAQGVSRPAFFRVEPNPDALPERPLFMPVVMSN